MALLGFLAQITQSRDDLCFLITSRKDYHGEAWPAELGDVAVFQTLPEDMSEFVKEFLDHWSPDLLFWMDGRVDIALLSEAHKRQIASIWVNARAPDLPRTPFPMWRGGVRLALDGFDTILAENKENAAALSRLGVSAKKIQVAGVLQKQTQPPGCNLAERDDIANRLGARPVWLALRVSERECNTVLAAHRQAMRKSHRLLLIVVPDDQEIASKLVQQWDEEGWVVACRSEGADPTPEVQIYVADLPDEEALWMHLSPITFMGQTLFGGDCASPCGPASLGSVVLFGPNPDHHADMFQRLERAGAARKIRDEAGLALEVGHLLQPENAAKMAMAAWDVTTSGAELASQLEEQILEMLDKRGK